MSKLTQIVGRIWFLVTAGLRSPWKELLLAPGGHPHSLPRIPLVFQQQHCQILLVLPTPDPLVCPPGPSLRGFYGNVGPIPLKVG